MDEPESPTVQIHEVQPDLLAEYARRDFDDIVHSDVFVLQPNHPTKIIIRAGRFVELGIAIALALPILVVGHEHANIFHYLPQVKHYDNWDVVKTHLNNMASVVLRDIPF